MVFGILKICLGGLYNRAGYFDNDYEFCVWQWKRECRKMSLWKWLLWANALGYEKYYLLLKSRWQCGKPHAVSGTAIPHTSFVPPQRFKTAKNRVKNPLSITARFDSIVRRSCLLRTKRRSQTADDTRFFRTLVLCQVTPWKLNMFRKSHWVLEHIAGTIAYCCRSGLTWWWSINIIYILLPSRGDTLIGQYIFCLKRWWHIDQTMYIAAVPWRCRPVMAR